MTVPYFLGPNLDDVMRYVIEDILANGIQINPSKGRCTELTGVLLEITNPRARFSRTETKGKPFSSLGELSWYLAKTNDMEFISYYLSKYHELAEDGVIYGGYGPRLFEWKGINQISQVISKLRENPDTRKAVIQLFDARDIVEEHKDVPCTCTMQFLVRDKKLQMITYMRSNDVIKGLPHDVFCFTMLQEIIAVTLSLDLGSYKHSVGSIHLYDDDKENAIRFLNEGWQPTDIAMPPMPFEDPWDAIQLFLEAEFDIRAKGRFSDKLLESLNPYWADLVRMLQVFRYWREKNKDGILEMRRKMSSNVYNSYIDKRLSLF